MHVPFDASRMNKFVVDSSATANFGENRDAVYNKKMIEANNLFKSR